MEIDYSETIKKFAKEYFSESFGIGPKSVIEVLRKGGYCIRSIEGYYTDPEDPYAAEVPHAVFHGCYHYFFICRPHDSIEQIRCRDYARCSFHAAEDYLSSYFMPDCADKMARVYADRMAAPFAFNTLLPGARLAVSVAAMRRCKVHPCAVTLLQLLPRIEQVSIMDVAVSGVTYGKSAAYFMDGGGDDLRHAALDYEQAYVAALQKCLQGIGDDSPKYRAYQYVTVQRRP